VRLVDGVPQEEEWPMLFAARHAPEDEFVLEDFLAVWHGEKAHEYGEMAVIGTLALALVTLGRAATQDAALAEARTLWQQRRP